MKTRKLTVTAMLAAVATVLMLFSFPLPSFMPGFIKMDFSELPALLASFAFGPWYGVLVCLVKNIINAFFTTTGGVGEFSNFLLGAIFSGTAGLIYQKKRTLSGAFVGSLAGTLAMAVIGIFTNYFVVYPVYAKLMPMDAIVKMYQAINPNVTDLWTALIYMNFPFTLVKGVGNAALTFILYKRLSPLFFGKRKQ